MAQYKCKSCGMAVAGHSTAADVCAGDYPFWSCCNCASTHGGWAGWGRRACTQCRQRDEQVRAPRACAFLPVPAPWRSHASARAHGHLRRAAHGDKYMPKKIIPFRVLSHPSAYPARDWHAGERCGCERGKGK